MPTVVRRFTMGVLDPPGFDVSTRRNTFDHLLTNIVNEQLLYHYNQNVFAWEIVRIAVFFFDFISTKNNS